MARQQRSSSTEFKREAAGLVLDQGYSVSEAKQDVRKYLMGYYNWQRPQQYKGGFPPAAAEENPKLMPGIS